MAGANLNTNTKFLSGWGNTSVTNNVVITPDSPEALRSALRQVAPNALEHGMIPRGLGRSYGDCAQCSGGVVIDLSQQQILYKQDIQSGQVTVSSGMSIDALIRHMLPLGFFVPVTPGTRHITVGGAIAADVHGKNHHLDGSFGNYIPSMKILTPSGIVTAQPQGETSEIFWATVGGLGLTGVVEQADLSLIPVETQSMVVSTTRTRDLDELLSVMNETDHNFKYSVAWIDCLAKGSNLGRGVLTQANHALKPEITSANNHISLKALYARASKLISQRQLSINTTPPLNLLNRNLVRVFNEVWFRKAPSTSTTSIQSISSFFYPLDAIGGWNRLYGKRGFIQYQFVVPYGCEPELRMILEMLSEAKVSSFLAVLKRFGGSSQGLLSFPMPGWTLAVDIAVGSPNIAKLLDQFDEIIVSAKGRVYLAKDSRLDPKMIPKMYPNLDNWRSIRDRLDPKRLMASDLSRRLELI